MLVNTVKRLLLRTPLFSFGGSHAHGHGHHEFNRDKISLKNQASGYYLDPSKVTREVIRILALYDKVQNPENITLKSKWHQMGIDEIDFVNIMVGMQQNFDLEFPDPDLEKFKNVEDLVEYVARSFHAK